MLPLSAMRLGWVDRTRSALLAPALEQVLANRTLRRKLAASRSRPIEGRVLDEHLAAMLRLDDFAKDSVLVHSTPEKARQRMAASVRIADAPSTEPVETRDLSWQAAKGQRPGRLYTPAGLRSASEALLFIHGGGWVTGDLDTHDSLCRKLASGGRLRVLSIDYRLAPEHRFPAAVDDSVAAMRWMVAQAGELGIDPKRIAVGGDSAGGNLAAVVGRKCGGDATPPALTVLLYAACDAMRSDASHSTFAEGWFLTRSMIDWYYAHYTEGSGDVTRHPDVSPIHAADLERAPPALIYPAHFDPLRDDCFDYAGRLTAAGVAAEVRHEPLLVHAFLRARHMSPAAAASFAAIVEAARSLACHGRLPAGLVAA